MLNSYLSVVPSISEGDGMARRRFSERIGVVHPRVDFQTDSMDEGLKNQLWNVFFSICDAPLGNYGGYEKQAVQEFMRRMWDGHFKLPLDEFYGFEPGLKQIRALFFRFDWAETYDFIQSAIDFGIAESFIPACNEVLQQELAGYTIIGEEVVPITGEQEIEEIEKAMSYTKGKLKLVSEHTKQAVRLFSDRKDPDYRNSIKESISAVETLCKIIVGLENATLGQALNKITDAIEIHPALVAAYEKLYGYTCNDQGIRHSMLDESTLEAEDARFMLVSCSAFVNYLVVKARKANIAGFN